MKKGIHPLQRLLRVVDTKGGSRLVLSVAQPPKGALFLQHDTTTHPAWTGKAKEVANTGQVYKFRQRFGLSVEKPAAAVEPSEESR
jgi:ribosomal protein L31